MIKYQSSCAKLSPFFGRRFTPYRDNDISLEKYMKMPYDRTPIAPQLFQPPTTSIMTPPPRRQVPLSFCANRVRGENVSAEYVFSMVRLVGWATAELCLKLLGRQTGPGGTNVVVNVTHKMASTMWRSPNLSPFVYTEVHLKLFFFVGHQLEHPFNGHAAPENHSTSFSARARLRDDRWKLASLALWLATPQKDAEKSIFQDFQDVSSMIFKNFT